MKEHNVLVGVSYDILPELHDAVRVDAGQNPTSERVRQAIRLLERHHVEYNVLCTLTNQIARHPQQVWKQLVRLNIGHTQFTPCLDELNRPGESVYALTPKRFASFYNTLFPYWLADYRAGKYRSVKFFDDVITYLAFGVPGTCGMGGMCQPQLVVEADGSAYPCDFYCLDAFKLGSLTELTVPELLDAPAARAFAQRSHTPPQRCGGCRFFGFCGGGCKRMQREICCSGTDSFCGYASFLETNFEALREIALAEQRAPEPALTLRRVLASSFCFRAVT